MPNRCALPHRRAWDGHSDNHQTFWRKNVAKQMDLLMSTVITCNYTNCWNVGFSIDDIQSHRLSSYFLLWEKYCLSVFPINWSISHFLCQVSRAQQSYWWAAGHSSASFVLPGRWIGRNETTQQLLSRKFSWWHSMKFGIVSSRILFLVVPCATQNSATNLCNWQLMVTKCFGSKQEMATFLEQWMHLSIHPSLLSMGQRGL